jgi:hypothetical protein
MNKTITARFVAVVGSVIDEQKYIANSVNVRIY